MLVQRAATFFFSFPLPTCHKQQQLLPYGTSEGTLRGLRQGAFCITMLSWSGDW